eukprot:403375794
MGRDADPAQTQILPQNLSLNQSLNTSQLNNPVGLRTSGSKSFLKSPTPNSINKSATKLSRNGVVGSQSSSRQTISGLDRSNSRGQLHSQTQSNIGSFGNINKHILNSSRQSHQHQLGINTSTTNVNVSVLISDNNSSINNLGNGLQTQLFNNQQQNQTIESLSGGTSIRANNKYRVPLEEDVLHKSKYKALKAENKKLKELLRNHESILGSKINESKQEQQQTIILCNLIFPIISGVLGVKHFQSPNSQQPKNFVELIHQLEELHQAIKKGSIGNLVIDFQVAKTEAANLKKENDLLRMEKQKFDLQIEGFKETMMRNEILHKQNINRFIHQVRELKALKKQLTTYFTNGINVSQQNLSTRSNQQLRLGADAQHLQNTVSQNQNRRDSFSNHAKDDMISQNYFSPTQSNHLPSFFKVLAVEELLEEQDYEHEKVQQQNFIDNEPVSPKFINSHQAENSNNIGRLVQSPQIILNSASIERNQQNLNKSSSKLTSSNISMSFNQQHIQQAQILHQGNIRSRSNNIGLEMSKNTSVPEISSQDLGPKRHQQPITLNNMKGLHFHQQTNNLNVAASVGAGQALTLTDLGRQQTINNLTQQIQLHQQNQQQQANLINQRRRDELGGKKVSDISLDVKREDQRKSSFSPSIFVRRYLPFFK